MAEVSPQPRCCVRDKPGHGPCNLPSMSDAPFPICRRHVMDMARYTMGLDVLMLADLRADPPVYRPPADHREPYRSVVYYVRVGDKIKVGYTGRIRERLNGYPPYSVLLATEPGGLDLEKSRHLHFRDDLAAGREWFHPSAALIAHVNSLREQPLTAAEMAA